MSKSAHRHAASTKQANYKELHVTNELTHENDHDHDNDHDVHQLNSERGLVGGGKFVLVDIEALRLQTTTTEIKDKTANPAVLGLLGFGLTTFLLNMHNAGIFPINSMI